MTRQTHEGYQAFSDTHRYGVLDVTPTPSDLGNALKTHHLHGQLEANEIGAWKTE
jgi:hypothetical protein